MNQPREMPSFRVLSAALRKTTEHLARELSNPTDSPPKWNELEWSIARAVATIHGTATLLANHLRWSGPSVWQSFLAEQREQCLLRHERIGALIERLDTGLREKGVACVALKGAAIRALGLYCPGEKPMADVDLFAAPSDLPSIAALLAEIDYTKLYTTSRHAVYTSRQTSVVRSFGEHVANPLKVEIHTEVAEELPVRKVDLTGRLNAGLVSAGLNPYPDLVALFLHLLLHTAGNMRANALRQIHLHDIMKVAGVLPKGHWRVLLEKPRDSEALWWVYPPLALTERYFSGCIPGEVLHAARAICPRLLRSAIERRTLTDVSWSNLRIHAFPGITWSRSPLEALRFVRSRVLPSQPALADLAVTAQAQPHLYRLPWYGVSHGKRILRWLFSRPPRVQTFLSVRAVLERSPDERPEAVR